MKLGNNVAFFLLLSEEQHLAAQNVCSCELPPKPTLWSMCGTLGYVISCAYPFIILPQSLYLVYNHLMLLTWPPSCRIDDQTLCTLSIATQNTKRWKYAVLKVGEGCNFESCDISLENTPTSHPASLLLLILCMPVMILQCLFCCLCNNSPWSLPSFVSPFSGTVLLLWCSWLNITMYYGILTFERKAPFATNFIQNRGIGLFLRVGQFFEIRVLLHVLLN